MKVWSYFNPALLSPNASEHLYFQFLLLSQETRQSRKKNCNRTARYDVIICLINFIFKYKHTYIEFNATYSPVFESGSLAAGSLLQLWFESP